MDKDLTKSSSYKYLFGEIRNRTIVEVYLAMKDLISQNQYSKRVGIDSGQFSKLLKKLQGNPPTTPQT